MPKIAYIERNFRNKQRQQVAWADQTCRDFARQGYSLTLRQLYYQFVSKGFIPNNDREYNKLGDLISNARRAGLIDWNHINDRTRTVRGYSTWDNASQIMDSAASSFKYDLWERTEQQYRPQVWVEKDALVDVVARACATYRVPYLSCRGYASDSVIWGAAQEFRSLKSRGITPVIIHLGDHDPSGLDMTRDIGDRLALFGGSVHVLRVALNMDQIERYAPPPNPAKITDSRFAQYRDGYGDESWELDALAPNVIGDVIANELTNWIDNAEWDLGMADEVELRSRLGEIGDRWDEIDANWSDIETLLDERN
jgi:hypothetical protein